MNEDDLRGTLATLSQHAAAEPDALDRIKDGRRRLESRRRNTFVATAMASVIAVAVIAFQVIPRDATGDPPGFATGAPTEPGDPQPSVLRASKVAFVYNDGLYTYDVRTGIETYRAGAGGDPNRTEAGDPRHRLPRYTEDGRLRWVTVYGDGSSVVREETRDGEPRLLLRHPNEIVAIDHGQAGIAFIERDDVDGSRLILLPAGSTNLASTIWEFPASLGRGITSEDAAEVRWSPDGRYLMVMNTYIDASPGGDETLLILDVSKGGSVGPGTNDMRKNLVIEPLSGTHGIWLDDERFAYVPFFAEDGDRWRIFDLTTGEETPLLSDGTPFEKEGAANPALSPDGTRLAIEDADNNEISIIDLATSDTTIIEGASPLWIGPDKLIVNEMVACGPDLCPAGEPWIASGDTFRVDISDGVKRTQAKGVASVSDAAVLLTSSTEVEG